MCTREMEYRQYGSELVFVGLAYKSCAREEVSSSTVALRPTSQWCDCGAGAMT